MTIFTKYNQKKELAKFELAYQLEFYLAKLAERLIDHRVEYQKKKQKNLIRLEQTGQIKRCIFIVNNEIKQPTIFKL